ncbi:hypothetical protein BBD42_22885 [Paenibacillus sp. BIHB 4019]|uniref:Uncharacterized protein n=1 Tax=Paenibacillus sp. BIHB 4019 TaxID=1870819 RepID=A0A1B2DMU5_9BACL|nr:hypothetical protein [Paenibacillus sp. BIHB 4019]ANY69011.1 hypothetical protein BBD42_22885 [Paenibacillus sp. BIHB 4019]
MDKKLLKALKKLYKYTNSKYDRERSISLYNTDILEPSERELLEHYHWEANKIELLTHDELNRKLIALQSTEAFSWASIAGIFVAGVGGSFPAGISSLINYKQMIHMQEHPYEQAERFLCCKYCGFTSDQYEHLAYIRYAVHLGNAYDSTVGAYAHLTELAELTEQSPIVPTTEDIQKFTQLLHFIDEAEDDETPGKLEKRLTAAKLLKGTPGMRRSILQSLAWVGVLPNTVLPLALESRTNIEDVLKGGLQLSNTKGRSDLEMPWAGWKGELGVDWDKARQLFGNYISGQ